MQRAMNAVEEPPPPDEVQEGIAAAYAATLISEATSFA